MQTDLIIINDFCDRCHVDPSFIMELEEDGLIEVRVIDEERYLPTSQLAELERYTHLYYDLSFTFIFLFLPLFLYDKQECRTDHHRFSSHYYIYQEKVMGCSALSSFFHLFSYFFPLYYPTFNLKSLSL